MVPYDIEANANVNTIRTHRLSFVTRDWYLSQRSAWSEKLTKDLEVI